MEEQKHTQKIRGFMKKYGYYLLVGFCLLALALIIIISTTLNKSTVQQNNNNNQEVNATATTFTLPVLNATVYKEYNDKSLVYNKTLNQWEAHKSIDFLVASGSNVYAIADGTVKEVYTNYLEGTVVVIEHGDNLTSKYGSLKEEVSVKVGDKVKKGDVIGTASDSAMRETDIGTYLHFEMLEGETKVDPAGYLNISNK